jgi:hypothetical protein
VEQGREIVSSNQRRTREYRIEVYLREDTYGTFDAQRRVLDRLEAVEGRGVLGSIGTDRWDARRTVEYDHREGALSTVEEFEDWARHNDATLEPAFERRIRTVVGGTEAREVVVFPVIALAVYRGEDLRAVFPCSVGDAHYTVHDCLDAFESGNVDRFLERFTPRDVARRRPRLREDTGAGSDAGAGAQSGGS